MDTTKHLKRSFVSALFALLIALFAMVAATFAWYIYNTSAHTTNVHMAAGASSALKISNTYDGEYRSAAELKSFSGFLNPVSTDRIDEGRGFQKVIGFTNGSENQPNLVANLFGPGETSDYYRTELFLKTNGEELLVYLSKIGYEDDDDERPISTAIRIGIVAHEPGEGQPETGEYIFSINDKDNPDPEGYNTATGEEGYVLDSTKTDGTTVPFQPYDSTNYCLYNPDDGKVTLKPDSVPICTVKGDGSGDYGEAVRLDIYIWLEGCDKDCTQSLCDRTLKNLALSFAGTKAK